MERNGTEAGSGPALSPADIEGAIALRQPPVIDERLAELGGRIKAGIRAALELAAAEESPKEIKRLRAELNAGFGALEDARKRVKREVCAPYDAFEAAYRAEITEPYKKGIALLDAKAAEIDGERLRRKREEIEGYYGELCESHGVDFVPFARWGPKVNLTVSEKALKEQAAEFVGGIAECLLAIEGMESRDEVLAEYRQCLSLPAAARAVESRRAAAEAERRRREESAARKQAEAERLARAESALARQQAPGPPKPLAPPKARPAAKPAAAPEKDPDEILRISFSVEGTKTRREARELDSYLRENGWTAKITEWSVAADEQQRHQRHQPGSRAA